MAQVKPVGTGEIRPDRRGAEVFHPLGRLSAQWPGGCPRGGLLSLRQVGEQVLHPLGQLVVRAAEQQARRLERIAVMPLASGEKIDPATIFPAADQQLQQPGVTGKPIFVAPQTKRRAEALRQEPVAVDRLRQHAFICAGDDQVRCIFPRQLEPALQVDRVGRPLREQRSTAKVIQHQRQLLRRTALGCGRHCGIQLGQAVVQLGNRLDAGFVRGIRAIELAIGKGGFQKNDQANRQWLLRQLVQRVLQQTQRRAGRDTVANFFLLPPRHNLQPGRRRQVGRDMFQPQLIQPPQQGRRLNRVILLRQPMPRIRQAEQCVRVGERRVLQHRQQRLQEGVQRCAPDRLPGRVETSNAGFAQLAPEMRDHLRVGRADGDRVVYLFFVPLQPVDHIAGLSAFVERRVKLLVDQRQTTLGPALRHRPAPVFEQRLAALRAKNQRLDGHPLPRRFAKRGLHQRRQVGDAYQHDPPYAVRHAWLGRSGALGIVRIAQFHLGQRGAVNRFELGQVLPAGTLRFGLPGCRHGGAVTIGIDQRAAQLVQRSRHLAAPVKIHHRRQPRKQRGVTPQRLALQHGHPMPVAGHRVGNRFVRFIAGEHNRRCCRLRREETAATLGHLARQRLAEPPPRLLRRQQKESVTQIGGAAGLTRQQPLRG